MLTNGPRIEQLTLTRIPVVNLFAGAGALDEGFASVRNGRGEQLFDIRLSLEPASFASRSLMLRTLYRFLRHEYGTPLGTYYKYVRQEIPFGALLDDIRVTPFVGKAQEQAKQLSFYELSDADLVDLMRIALDGSEEWVLLGSPICQLYPHVIPSTSKSDTVADADPRHPLFRKYLDFIGRYRPSAFLFDKVVGGSKDASFMHRLYEDLSEPAPGLSYYIRPLRSLAWLGNVDVKAFSVCSEEHGIPQARQRVMMLAIREDLTRHNRGALARRAEQVCCRAVLEGMPKLRSPVVGGDDSFETWYSVLKTTPARVRDWNSPNRRTIERYLDEALSQASGMREIGAHFAACPVAPSPEMPSDLADWLLDPKLGGVVQHQARGTLAPDLQRYLFAASYATAFAASLPGDAWPAGLSFSGFPDKYNVQLGIRPARTISSHIAKEGHYFIHYDAAQCRSLTVREAARLQTFPDNYYFEGSRTQQYNQVGNAVPPFLAKQIGEVAARALGMLHSEPSLCS